MVLVRNLSCTRNERVIFKHLNFELAPGDGMQVQGHNGAGKSTLLKTIAGLLKPAQGTIQHTDSLMYCGHTNTLHASLTPLQNLSFLLALEKEPNQAKISEALQTVGLQQYSNTPCSELSAGQCQRIILARMMLADHSIWLLDEPYTNLDSNALELLYSICQQHLNRQGIILLATHRTITFCNRDLQLSSYA